jgi:hypothetical protein
MSMAMNLDLLDPRRARQESSFNTNAVGGDSPHREVGLVTAFPFAYNGATNQLDTFTLPFNDSQVYCNAVT